MASVGVVAGEEWMMPQVGRDLEERNHDEVPLDHSGVGHDQIGGVDATVPVEEDVDIERPGPPADDADPPGLILQFVAAAQEGFG